MQFRSYLIEEEIIGQLFSIKRVYGIESIKILIEAIKILIESIKILIKSNISYVQSSNVLKNKNLEAKLIKIGLNLEKKILMQISNKVLL